MIRMYSYMVKQTGCVENEMLPSCVRGVFAALSFCLAFAAAHGGASSDQLRPNVVMIVSDDQSWRDFGFLGNDLVHTPHIDGLANLSARYPAGYVPMSLCRASLATMLTGLYPHQHGIHFNHPPPGYGKRMRDMTAERYRSVRAKTDYFVRNAPALPAILARHGYASLQTGKFWEGHFSNAGFTHGMTTARPTERLGSVTGTRKQNNGEWVAHGNGDAGLVIGRETMQPIRNFIDEHAGRRPFFVWYAPFLPHTPYDAPPQYERAVRERGVPSWLVPYYANISWFDDTVGELLQYLEEKALLDATLIVFAVDNGLRPDPEKPTRQDARSKYSPYEDGLRTPILIYWQGRTKAADHPQAVSTIDLAPTILAAAGLADDITPRMRGRNLFPSAVGMEKLVSVPVAGAIYPSDASTLGQPSRHVRGRWIRHGDFKLIVPGSGPRSLPLQLFDLSKDPGETANLANSPAHADVVGTLKRLLDEWWSGADDDSVTPGHGEARPSGKR